MLILIIIVHVQPLTCTRGRDVDKNGSSVRNPDTLKHSANDNRSCRLSQVGLETKYEAKTLRPGLFGPLMFDSD